MMRIGALLRRIDPGLLDRWYLAAGTALHAEGKKPHRREVAEALTGLGGWGVPTLIFGGRQALSGPVLTEPPPGEAAIRLWQLLAGWLEFPDLYEVQRPERPAGLQAIATTFQPYLQARDWVTIQEETP